GCGGQAAAGLATPVPRVTEGLTVKYYLYTLFPNTEQNIVDHYVFKYGSEAAVRETLRQPSFTSGRGKASGYWNDAAIQRPNLRKIKQGVEIHDDVVVNGTHGPQGAKRLQNVKPWDTVTMLAHGMEINLYNEKKQFVGTTNDPNICSADDDTKTRT